MTAGTDLSVREGLAAGAATIVPDIPAVRELLGDSAALFVRPTDEYEISKAILYLLNNRLERERLQHEAFATAKTAISRSSVAKLLILRIPEVRKMPVNFLQEGGKHQPM